MQCDKGGFPSALFFGFQIMMSQFEIKLGKIICTLQLIQQDIDSKKCVLILHHNLVKIYV